jgi:hypothetical protein
MNYENPMLTVEEQKNLDGAIRGKRWFLTKTLRSAIYRALTYISKLKNDIQVKDYTLDYSEKMRQELRNELARLVAEKEALVPAAKKALAFWQKNSRSTSDSFIDMFDWFIAEVTRLKHENEVIRAANENLYVEKLDQQTKTQEAETKLKAATERLARIRDVSSQP